MKISYFSSLRPYSYSQIPSDILAGLSLVALAIPQAMAYTNIAGTPVITGLYTILLPPILFALFGSSRFLVVGADSATAAIIASGLTGIVASGTGQYAAYASLLALMTGIFLLFARLINLGFLADFLSRTVLVGFLTGVGIKISIAQFHEILGLPGRNISLKYDLQNLLRDFQEISEFNFYTLALSGIVFAILILSRTLSKKLPGGLFALLIAMAASYFFHLSEKGVATIGQLPGGLPMLSLPPIELNWNVIEKLVPIAFSLVVMIIAQSAATSRAFAIRFHERVDENQNLTGLGLANLGAGFTGAFVVNGTPTETQTAVSFGSRSQITQMTASMIVMIVLLFFTGPLAYLPKAALASMVLLIGLDLIDIRGMKKIYRQSASEFWVALITTALVIFVGVIQAILVAVVLSLIDHTRRGYRPKNNLIALDERSNRYTVPVEKRIHLLPGLVVYRFNHSMYYANTYNFSEEILDQIENTTHPIYWFCLDATAIGSIDVSAAETIREVFLTLHHRGIRFVLSGVADHVRQEMERYGLIKLLGRDSFFSAVPDVESAFRSSVKITNGNGNGNGH